MCNSQKLFENPNPGKKHMLNMCYPSKIGFIQTMLFPLEVNRIPKHPILASKGSRARVVPHRMAGKAIPDAPGICSATWCSSKEPATGLDRWNNAVRHGTTHEFHAN